MNREKVIKALQSILLSCKSGMVIHELIKEYREMEGISIPFRAFGCDNLADFLRTSGSFVVKPSDDGMMVLAKQTANSKHVNDLVKGQTPSKKTRKSLRRKRSKLQHPRTPLEIIYENDRALRYGIQSISRQIQPRGNRRVIGSVGDCQRQPLTQIHQNSIGSQINNKNSRNDQCSVGPVNKVVAGQVHPALHPVQKQQSQPTAPVNDTHNEQSLGSTTTKPANIRCLSKFSQALIRAMKMEPMPEPEPQFEPFDFAELKAYPSPVQAIDVYCSKKGLPEPKYHFIYINTKKIICSVIVDKTRYGCYPHEYQNRIDAQKATAKIALLEIKELEESKMFPVCNDSAYVIAQQINACIGENGVFLDSLQTVFQSNYQQSLPDKWRLIVQNNTDLFNLETNIILGKTIVYSNKLNNSRANGTSLYLG